MPNCPTKKTTYRFTSSTYPDIDLKNSLKRIDPTYSRPAFTLIFSIENT